MDSHLYVAGQSIVMTEEPITRDETTYGQWNITAIPYKYNYTLFSCGRWARQKTPAKRKLEVKLNLTDRTIFFNLICSAQISHSSQQIDNCGMWPIFGSWRHRQTLHAVWLCGYVLSLILVHRGTFFFKGEEQERLEGNDEAAIIQNVHLALPASSAKAFWESDRFSRSPLRQAIIWTRFPNLQGSAVIAPPQGEIRW